MGRPYSGASCTIKIETLMIPDRWTDFHIKESD